MNDTPDADDDLRIGSRYEPMSSHTTTADCTLLLDHGYMLLLLIALSCWIMCLMHSYAHAMATGWPWYVAPHPIGLESKNSCPQV